MAISLRRKTAVKSFVYKSLESEGRYASYAGLCREDGGQGLLTFSELFDPSNVPWARRKLLVLLAKRG